MPRCIGLLLGAGCEGKGQLGLPSGVLFKRDTIVADKVADLVYGVNRKEHPAITNGTIIAHNSYSILYQTLLEYTGKKFSFSQEEKEIVDRYISLSNGNISVSEQEKTDIRNAFAILYKIRFYDEIKNSVTSGKALNEDATLFLENACFYSFVDSRFNYLRKPGEYRKESNRVVKLYFAAFKSILSSLLDPAEQEALSNALLGKHSLRENRLLLHDLIVKSQQRIVDANQGRKDLYYNIIRSAKAEHSDVQYSIVTTNYTNFIELMTGISGNNLAYVHGKLDTFEDIESKRVGNLTSFAENAFIFPFIFIQSGIKPVVNGFQIDELSKARSIIAESDELIILGYGVNSDDEHISNLLRERIRAGKTITCLLYQNDGINQKKVLETLQTSSGVKFGSSADFESFLG